MYEYFPSSKKLHIAQPPLSAQMKALENEYGISLFERGSRSIKLTTTGTYLYERARHILTEMDEINLELSNISNMQKSILRN